MPTLFAFLLISLATWGCSTPDPSTLSTAQKNHPLPLISVPDEHPRTGYEAFSNQFMIATQGRHASQASKLMFEKGGNIIDAAAAASFVISVERPHSTGIGGGGFMLIYWARTQEILAFDFREQAPAQAHAQMFLDDQGEVIPRLSLEGALASGVPGLVAGVLEIHEKYGKLTRDQILAPAIKLAEEGFAVYPHLAKAMHEKKDLLRGFPTSRNTLLKEGGQPFQPGEILRQQKLAKTLGEIARRGKDGFYRGWVAEATVKELQRWGGTITHQDLQSYQVRKRKAVQGKYKDYEVYSMPPPSSGGVHVVQILNILGQDQLASQGPASPLSIHLTASAMQLAFADRATYLGDPDFVEVPLPGLTSSEYAAQLRRQIPENRAQPSKKISAGNPLPFENEHTTHFSIMDGEGNVVASTQTINGWFGSGVMIPEAGFLMNNEMDDFSAKPGAPNLFGALGGKRNAIAPRKRPLSSMTPTIVMKEGKPVLALGSPSGTRIISCVVQTLLNYLEYELPLYESVASIRYHHQWQPDEIRVDEPFFPPPLKSSLEEMGYKINEESFACRIQAVAREDGKLHGVSDPRGEGLAIGN